MLATLNSLIRWTLGAVVLFFWTMILVVLTRVATMRKVHAVARFGFRQLLAVAGLKVKVRGLEHVDPAKGYLCMSNHVNLFEPFVMGAYFPGWIVAIEKKENFKLPIYGSLIKAWGNIPIDRQDLKSAMESLRRAQEALASGVSIQIMPEGTRSRSGELGAFKKGGFHMAIDAGATILPFAFRNMYTFSHTGSWKLTPTEIELVFTPPIDASAYTKDELQALSDKVRGQIAGALEAPAPEALPASERTGVPHA